MINWLWIWVLQEGIPLSSSNNFVAYVRIHNLEPCACWVVAVVGHLSVPQLFEAFPSSRRTASIRSHKDIEGIKGVRISFTHALHELVELEVGYDLPQLERHFGGDCQLWRDESSRSGRAELVKNKVVAN